ncbi:MAG TPA: hypothetical protein VL282_15875 [Tepidisphaeraceae bacterium]|jgi:hypothetical protein|nr:hypothetical protein [Tepidisphaeraceae bacterium]
MGNWWGAVHFKTSEREAIRAAVGDLAVKRELKCLLGPEINGWVSVYPQDNGQDTAVAEALAAATKFDAFHLLLCDDDVFAYNFFRGGKLVDEYTSAPGYFSQKDRAAEETMSGRPDRYADLLVKPLPDAQSILQRKPPGEGGGFYAMQQFERFAAALGIKNADTAYEYFEEGERDNLKRVREFEHIPDRSAEKGAKREAKAALKRQLDGLKAQGRLLGAYTGKKGEMPSAAIDPLGGGFLLSWMSTPMNKPSAIHRIAPPWPTKPPALDLPGEGRIGSLTTSHDGRWLAFFRHTQMSATLELWDLTTRQKVRDLPRNAMSMQFSRNDRFLVQTTYEQTQFIEIPSGNLLRSFPTQAAMRAIVHPSGKWLLIDQQTDLLLIALESDAAPKTLYLGGKSRLAEMVILHARKRFAAVDLEKHEKTLRANMDKAFAQVVEMMKRQGGKKGVPQMDDAAIAKLTEDREKQIAQIMDGMRKAQAGEAFGKAQANERISTMAFSADGRSLFCGTNLGLRVYDWEAILAGGEDVLHPRIAYQPTQTEPDKSLSLSYVYALAEDMHRNRLAFGAADGLLRFLDLETGEITGFLEMPDRATIIQMIFSADGTALGCACRSDLFEDSSITPMTFYVWRA